MENKKYSMMPIEEVQEMLGYTDLKSIRNWCNENEVPIIRIGKRYYIHSWLFEIALLRHLKTESDNQGMDGSGIVNAILNDDKIELIEIMSAPADQSVIGDFRRRKKNETIEDTLNNYRKKVG